MTGMNTFGAGEILSQSAVSLVFGGDKSGGDKSGAFGAARWARLSFFPRLT